MALRQSGQTRHSDRFVQLPSHLLDLQTSIPESRGFVPQSDRRLEGVSPFAGTWCHPAAHRGQDFDLGQNVNVERPEDIRLSFNEAADIYDRVRPSYPADLFDALFQMLPPQPEIVEVGPGTGQATKDLLARGASVLAIEIGPATAAKLRSNLPSDRLRVGVGDFEVMEIVAGQADAVVSATAYHWISKKRRPIDPLQSCEEAASLRSST